MPVYFLFGHNPPLRLISVMTTDVFIRPQMFTRKGDGEFSLFESVSLSLSVCLSRTED